MSPVRDTASAVVAPADVADHATSVMLHHVFAENVPMLGRELAATAQVQMYTTPPAADYSAVPVLMSLAWAYESRSPHPQSRPRHPSSQRRSLGGARRYLGEAHRPGHLVGHVL